MAASPSPGGRRFLAGGDGNGDSVKMRIFNADGTPRTGEILVNTQAISNQIVEDIRQAPDGSIWVVFQDLGGNGRDISFRRFTTGGAALDVSDRVASNTANNEETGSIAFLNNGNAVIAYRDANDISARRFEPDGDLTGVTTTVAAAASVSRFRMSLRRWQAALPSSGKTWGHNPS